MTTPGNQGGNPSGGFSAQQNPTGRQANTDQSENKQNQPGSQGSVSRGAPRGFAAMDPEAQRRIASEGGRASHQSGRGHQWTSVEARAAGRKGGEARAANSQNNNSQGSGGQSSDSDATGITGSNRTHGKGL